MTLDTSKLEALRIPSVEADIKAQCAKNGMSQNVMAGDVMCLTTGRRLRWSIAIEFDPFPELFLSVHDQTNPCATDREVAYALQRFGFVSVRELNAETARQNTIRGFHVKGAGQ